MTLRRPPLRLEELGPRVLPSAASWIVPISPAPSSLVTPAATHALDGRGHGAYSGDVVQSGAGAEYNLYGQAHLEGLGNVRVSGSVHAVGFIQNGRAGGTLTFTNAHGSVTVELQGPEQSGFSALPEQFSYRVTAGTGAYDHLSGHGSLTLSLHATPAGAGAYGTFALSIPASPKPHDSH